MNTPALTADTPSEWIEVHLTPHMRSYDTTVDEATREWLTIADLFADNAAHLRNSHHRIMTEDGATPAAAAKWLVGWYPGRLAHAIGYLYAFASAAIVIDPHTLRFGRHPDGWTQLIDLGQSEIVVAEGHPWSTGQDFRVVKDDQTLAEIGLASLRAVSQPILDSVRTLAKVGAATLWSEVIDEFALATLSQREPTLSGRTLTRVDNAVRTPGMPWRKYPEFWLARTRHGLQPVGRKGGCCLAYQCDQPNLTELDAETKAWRERFPADARGRNYCNTCSLLERADCQARQLFHLTQGGTV